MPTAIAVGTNSYATIIEANTFLDDLIYSGSWEFLGDDTKTRALITAFTDLDQLGLVDSAGVAIVIASAPEDIKRAQSELAFIYTEDPDAAEGVTSGSTNLRRVKADTVEVEFFIGKDGTRFPIRVMRTISNYLPGASGGSVLGSLATGSCDASSFDSADRHGLTEGYA